MDLITAVRHYVVEMIRIVGPGMKVLLMDQETVDLNKFSVSNEKSKILLFKD